MRIARWFSIGRSVGLILLLSATVFVSQSAAAKTNTPPVANPGGPYEGTTDATQPILFDGSASFDADGSVVEYAWDFGDETTGTGEYVFHSYQTPGVFTASLTVNDGTEDSDPAITQVKVGLAPPSAPTNPQNGASSIAFPLLFKWKETEEAQSYFYNILGMEESFLATEEMSGIMPQTMIDALSQKPQPYQTYEQKCQDQLGKECTEAETQTLIKKTADTLSPKPYEEYKKQCEITKEKTCSEEDIQRVIVEKQRHYWRVKSCAVLAPAGPDDPACGPWSDPLWSFVYIPQPPKNLEQPSPGASGVAMPAFLRWTPVENINSYLVDIRLDIGCSIVDNIVGFFIGGDCNPLNFFTEAVFEWFGFGENYDPSCPWNLWNENTKECVPLPIIPRLIQEDPLQEELFPEYQDAEQNILKTTIPGVGEKGDTIEGQCVFSKNAPYKITVASCLDKQAKICGEWSDAWTFSTGSVRQDGTPYTLPAPIHLTPEYKPGEVLPIVGKNTSLHWKAQNCVHYVQLFVSPVGGSPIIQEKLPNLETVDLSGDKFQKLWDASSDLNKEYVWNLRSCWRVEDAISCEAAFSDEWHFMTTGAAPLLKSPDNKGFIKVPNTLTWQPVDGAGSYVVQIAQDEDFDDITKQENIQGTSFALSLDGFTLGSQYWWRVKTCADTAGGVCGEDWSQVRSFSTYPLLALINPEPINGAEFPVPGTLKWKPDDGASYYQYQIRYTSLKYGVDKDGKDILEDRSACTKRTLGDTVVPQPGEVSPITSQPSFYLSEYCRGEYTWLVFSCADKNCNVTAADPATLWKFTATKQTSEESAGLVPCGKTVDHVSTPYDETESCQLKHAGFLLQNLLDFILWKVSLFVLLVLAVMTGATSYFSLGGPNALARIKTVFKSFFVGFLILMFAWMFVNIILMLFGFQFEFFGKWWEISF